MNKILITDIVIESNLATKKVRTYNQHILFHMFFIIKMKGYTIIEISYEMHFIIYEMLLVEN